MVVVWLAYNTGLPLYPAPHDLAGQHFSQNPSSPSVSCLSAESPPTVP